MNSDDYVDIVKIMMMKWCLCDDDDHDQDCDVVDLKLLMMLLWFKWRWLKRWWWWWYYDMMYVCVHRYKYVCVHYQFLSPYWLQHIMIYSCSSTIRCIFIWKTVIFHHTHHHHPHTPYYSVCHYLHIIISHLISLLLLPFFSSISLCTISYSITVKRLSIWHVRMDMRVPYWYCYRIKQTLTLKMR